MPLTRRRAAPPAPSFGAAELHGGGSRVSIIPALGGKIAAMELGGRQWLWTSDVIPHAEPTYGASYVETADSGGYDECFPTVGADTVPVTVTKFGGTQLPDHGELWATRPTIEVETLDGAQRATCVWRGTRLPYRFTRVVHVDGAGAVTMRYEVANDGKARLPFIWSAHPLLPLTPQTRLVLPEGTRVRVYAQHGIDLGGARAEHRWPRLTVERKKLVDFSRPDAVARHYACKLFLDFPPTPGRVHAAVEEGGARLDVEFDVEQVPHFGLWLNRRGWTPFKKQGLFGRTPRPYLNFAFEPCIGAPDTLSEALGPVWNAARWLEAGETKRWELVWRGAKAETDGPRAQRAAANTLPERFG
jgi:galactose mutarotase-like enzyme